MTFRIILTSKKRDFLNVTIIALDKCGWILQPCDSFFFSNEKSKKNCDLSKCEKRNARAIVSQKKLLFKKLVVKVSLDQEKNKLVVPRKRCEYQVKMLS